jgi:hypothetical protein
LRKRCAAVAPPFFKPVFVPDRSDTRSLVIGRGGSIANRLIRHRCILGDGSFKRCPTQAKNQYEYDPTKSIHGRNSK